MSMQNLTIDIIVFYSKYVNLDSAENVFTRPFYFLTAYGII